MAEANTYIHTNILTYILTDRKWRLFGMYLNYCRCLGRAGSHVAIYGFTVALVFCPLVGHDFNSSGTLSLD